MNWFRKVFGKTVDFEGVANVNAADPAEKVMRRLSDNFGDACVHHGFFSSVDSAKGFLKELSFMTVSQDELITPKNMQVTIIKYDDGARLFIGGQLYEDQNFEVLSLSRKCGIKFKSMSWASETSLVYQEFMKAALRYKESVKGSPE